MVDLLEAQSFGESRLVRPQMVQKEVVRPTIGTSYDAEKTISAILSIKFDDGGSTLLSRQERSAVCVLNQRIKIRRSSQLKSLIAKN